MILQGQDIPIHLGSLIPAMKSVVKFFEGEINALIGACQVCARNLKGLMAKYGKELVQECIAELWTWPRRICAS